MKDQKQTCFNVMVVLIGLLFVVNGYAGLDTQYGFYSITNNNIDDAQVGQQQLSVWVSDQGSMADGGDTLNLVGFKFMNEGQGACVIAHVYFQGGSLQEFVEIHDASDGVDFDEAVVGDVSPGNLPGGKSIIPKFIADRVLSIQTSDPAPHSGVGPGEYLEVIYALQPTAVFMDVLNELNNADLRIGIHVQFFANGGSESFVNTPEPVTVVLLGLGGLLLRRQK